MKKGVDYIGVGCGAFMFNEEGKLFLMKRNINCRNKAGFWSIPGGGVDYGERVQDALIREMKEELDIVIEVGRLLVVANDIISEENQHWISPQYICKIVGGKLKNMEPHKCEGFDWFDLESLPEKLTNTTLQGLEALKNENFNN